MPQSRNSYFTSEVGWLPVRCAYPAVWNATKRSVPITASASNVGLTEEEVHDTNVGPLDAHRMFSTNLFTMDWWRRAACRSQRRLLCQASRKALRLTNRPFLGYGGLNDAEWLASSRPLFYSNQYRSHGKGSSRLEAPQRFTPRQGGDSREESVLFLHLSQRLDVSRAYAARNPVPVLGRGGGCGRLELCARILEVEKASWPKSSRPRGPQVPRRHESPYAMLALTEASLVDDHVETTPGSNEEASRPRRRRAGHHPHAHEVGRWSSNLAEHQAALSNDRHRVQIHSRRRPLLFPTWTRVEPGGAYTLLFEASPPVAAPSTSSRTSLNPGDSLWKTSHATARTFTGWGQINATTTFHGKGGLGSPFLVRTHEAHAVLISRGP